jgi:ABC-type glycerol-3-phosphate transport system substrate-binding protein
MKPVFSRSRSQKPDSSIQFPPSPFRLPPLRFAGLIAVGLLSLVLSGCPQLGQDATKEPDKLPFAGVKLKLQVVDDPAMAKAIERLRGEWTAQSGSEFEIVEIGEIELSHADSLSADALICPSHLLGALAEKKLVAELPDKFQGGSHWATEFELPKIREASWGKKIYGLPFGSPLLTIYYRADLLEKHNQSPPKTWAEYQQLAKLLASEKPGTADAPWHGTLEPLAPGWAGLALLAQAAPYVKHPDNYSTWFDHQTMEPLIAGPPMVQALTELVDAVKPHSAAALKSDPSAVRRAFWAGQCGMAITWPTASEQQGGENQPAAKTGDIAVGFAELPGSARVYNVNDAKWENRPEDEPLPVPFLGISGRMGVVSAKSSAAEAAFALLVWLSDDQNSPQVCPVSESTTLFRNSHLDKPQVWTEKQVSALAAAQYARLTATALGGETWLGLRIPGREEYLAALDEAVRAAVAGDAAPADALAKTAEKWRQITDKHGKERQKTAYLHSLGLD